MRSCSLHSVVYFLLSISLLSCAQSPTPQTPVAQTPVAQTPAVPTSAASPGSTTPTPTTAPTKQTAPAAAPKFDLKAAIKSDCLAPVIGERTGSQVNLRSGPSINVDSPSYVLVGQKVRLLTDSQARDRSDPNRYADRDSSGNVWHPVEYEPSQTRGWIRGDFLGEYTCTASSGATSRPTGSETTANTDAFSRNGFIMPSKNIYCVVYSERLRCEIVSKLKPLPPQPADCNLDWGSGLVLTKTTPAEVLCAADSIYSPDFLTLSYGQQWESAGFLCKSAADGLTCTNPQGRGFFLNREEWKLL